MSHGGPLGDSYRHATGTDIGRKILVELYNTAINRIQISDGDWGIQSWGDIAHLSEIGSLANWEARIQHEPRKPSASHDDTSRGQI